MPDDKEVAYYAAKANAWFNTKLEYDKSILVLSAGAIGLLITLLTTVGVKSVVLLILFTTSIISFIVCLISVLAIFTRNAKHLEDLIQGNKTNDQLLGVLDALSIFSFILGVILASIIGISIAANNVLSKETEMTDKKETTNKTVELNESFKGANNISPQGADVISKSFNDAQNIAPPTQDNGSSSSTDNAAVSQSETQAQAADTGGSDKK